MYEKRREFLCELIKEKDFLGIEIGGLDKPLVVRSELSKGSEILYADHLSTKDLKEKYKADTSVDLNALVEVDLINVSGDFSSSLQGRLVDYIVASHVVEHVPNPIGWLQGLFDVLRPGGFVFLVVPDKRFTFDFQRPITTFGEMLESSFSNKRMPSLKDVFDHHSSAVMIDGGRVWNGLLGKDELIPLASNRDALQYAQEAHHDSKYHDVHVSIFTPASFFSIIECLIKSQMLLPEITGFRDTNINDIEFFVCLTKTESDDESVKQLCLASLPSLSLQSLTSPYMPQVESLSASLKKITNIHQEFQNSFARLESENQHKKEKIKSLEHRLDLSQRVLDRRSVKFVMAAVHGVVAMFSFFKQQR
jgi:hypothetical protein